MGVAQGFIVVLLFVSNKHIHQRVLHLCPTFPTTPSSATADLDKNMLEGLPPLQPVGHSVHDYQQEETWIHMNIELFPTLKQSISNES